MKTILALMFFVLTASEANAAWNTCLNITGCVATVTADSGVTAKSCENDSSTCECEAQSCHTWSIRAGSCLSGWTQMGTVMNGSKCCHQTSTQCPPANVARQILADEEQVTSTSNENLGDVFAPSERAHQAMVYHGWVNSVLRSPTGGRDNSTMAKLDVCMGDGDSSAAVATNSATTCGNQYCGSGSINEYCNANTQAVCRDRCECAINGITHSTCDLM